MFTFLILSQSSDMEAKYNLQIKAMGHEALKQCWHNFKCYPYLTIPSTAIRMKNTNSQINAVGHKALQLEVPCSSQTTTNLVDLWRFTRVQDVQTDQLRLSSEK